MSPTNLSTKSSVLTTLTFTVTLVPIPPSLRLSGSDDAFFLYI